MKSPIEHWQDLQEQNLQLLKAQQDAYITAVRLWQTQTHRGR